MAISGIIYHKRMNTTKFGVGVMMFAVLVFGALASSSQAQEDTTASPNYQVTEPQFGAGSELDTCSNGYCAHATIGNLDGGADTPSSASFGLIPQDSDPLLEVIVDPGVSYLGVLSTTETAKKTMIVRVRTYLTDGYTLHIYGTPPKYDSHTLSVPTKPTTSTPGTEQFALNVVRNTVPDFGADPVQVPSDSLSFGEVAPDYQTANLFKYVNGDMIASSAVETGRTDYTVSMIVNISNKTPAGHYSGDYSAIVIPRF